MAGTNSSKPASQWISRTCAFADTAEEVSVQMSTPQMQALLSALQLVGQVVGDVVWMEENDPERKLEGALPAQQRVGGDDAAQVVESLATESFGLQGQAAALRVAESWALLT